MEEDLPILAPWLMLRRALVCGRMGKVARVAGLATCRETRDYLREKTENREKNGHSAASILRIEIPPVILATRLQVGSAG